MCVRECMLRDVRCECWEMWCCFQQGLSFCFFDTLFMTFIYGLHCMCIRCCNVPFNHNSCSVMNLFYYLLAGAVMSCAIVAWPLTVHAEVWGQPFTRYFLTSCPCPASRRLRLATPSIPLRSVVFIESCEVCLFFFLVYLPASLHSLLPDRMALELRAWKHYTTLRMVFVQSFLFLSSRKVEILLVFLFTFLKVV